MKKRVVLTYQKNIISSKQVIDYRIWDYGLPGKIHPDMPGEERKILILLLKWRRNIYLYPGRRKIKENNDAALSTKCRQRVLAE
jgi:hypothetical protein